MRRVLLVSSYWPPYLSGVAEYARLLAEELVADHEVTVVTGRHEPGLPAERVEAGVRVLRAPLVAKLHKGYLSPALLTTYRREARRADVVNLHLPLPEAGALTALTPAGTPVVSTYQCDLAYGEGLVDRVAVAAVRASIRRAARRSRLVAVTSQDYAAGSALLAGTEDRWRVVVPPVKTLGRDWLPGPTGDGSAPLIGFVGRFSAEKGLDVLLAALRPLLQEQPGLRVELAGDAVGVAGGTVTDRLADDLRSLAPRVAVLGRLSEDELWDFYRRVDVLVLPSTSAYEAFGMVQVEAMTAGALVVASDLRGVRTPVLETGQGLLARPGDSADLTARLREALALRGERSREEVRAAAVARYGAGSVGDQYRALFAEAGA